MRNSVVIDSFVKTGYTDFKWKKGEVAIGQEVYMLLRKSSTDFLSNLIDLQIESNPTINCSLQNKIATLP